MVISPAKRSLRLRASAEAFDVLRENGSPKISNAELLKHSVRSDHEPHPRIVREVHAALVDARAAKEARQKKEMEDSGPISGSIKKISGIFARKTQPQTPALDDVIKRFEQAFILPD